MSFSLTLRIPTDSDNGELHSGSSMIVGGFEWYLVGKLIEHRPYVVETFVQCSKLDKRAFLDSKAELTYPTALTSNVEHFDPSERSYSEIRWFEFDEVAEIGNPCCLVTVDVKLGRVGYEAPSASCQTVQPIGATCADQDTPKLVDLENRIAGLEMDNEVKWSTIDENEQKCAQLVEIVKKLEERLKVTEKEIGEFKRQGADKKPEGPQGLPRKWTTNEQQQIVLSPEDQIIFDTKLRKLQANSENLRIRALQCKTEGNHDASHKLEVMLSVLEGKRPVSLEYLTHLESWIEKKADFLEGANAYAIPTPLKVTGSEASMKHEIEYLKTELKDANRKLELAQRVIVETEDTMADLEQKNEEKCAKLEETVRKLEELKERNEQLEDQLATKEAKVTSLNYNIEVMQKKLKEKDAEIERLKWDCKQYQQQQQANSQDPALQAQVMKVNARMKAAKSVEERESVFEDLKKHPNLFNAWLKTNGRQIYPQMNGSGLGQPLTFSNAESARQFARLTPQQQAWQRQVQQHMSQGMPPMGYNQNRQQQ